MAKGDTWASEIQEYTEPDTGVRVRRLTGSEADRKSVV